MNNKISEYCIMAKNLGAEQLGNLREAVLYENESGKLYMEGTYSLTNKSKIRGWWSELIPPQFIGNEKIGFQFNQQFTSPPPNLKRVNDMDPRRRIFLNGLRDYLDHMLDGGSRKNTKRNKKSSKLRSKKSSKLRSKKYSKLRSKKRTIRKH